MCPFLLIVVAIDGSLLAYPGTTGKEMLGGREQYLLLGYQYAILFMIGVLVVVPFVLNMAGACCKVTLSTMTLV